MIGGCCPLCTTTLGLDVCRPRHLESKRPAYALKLVESQVDRV